MSTEPLCTDPPHRARAGEGEALVPRQPTPDTVGSARMSTTGWRARLRRTPGGALLLQVLVFAAGLAFVVLGLVLIVAPGPLTIPPILLGLWIWSTEFRFAERFFDSFKSKAQEAWAHAKAHPASSAVITVGGLVAAGVAMWAVVHFELAAKGKDAIGL